MSTGAPAAAVATDNTHATEMRIIQASTTTSDLEVARKGATIALDRIAWLENELNKKSKKLSQLEQILISQAAAKRARRKIAGASPVPEVGLPIPRPLLIEGEAIHRHAHGTARVYYTFFSTYESDDIWTLVPEVVTFEYNEAKHRWDEELPENRLIGRAMELLKAADSLAAEWIKRNSLAFKQEFQTSIADARSETMKRTRDNGPELFDDVRDHVETAFAQHRQRGKPALTFTRQKQSPIQLHSFGKDLFLPESAGARGQLPGLLDLLGISQNEAGEWESDPIRCALMYKNYRVVPGEEFESELLFRICRANIYGPNSIRKKTGLTLNGKSPLKGFPLTVTPGLIVNTLTIARIALCPDDAFSGNGVGPTTKIRYIDDAEDLLEGLMTIWDTPRGRAIQEVWMKNVFPSQLTQRAPVPTKPVAAPRKTRTKAAVQLAAHAQVAQSTQAAAAQVPAQHVHQHESYRVPTNGFDITTHHAPERNDNKEEDDYGNLVTQTFLHHAETSDEEEEEDNSNILAEFDESAGEVRETRRPLPPPRQSTPIQTPVDGAINFDLASTSTPPRRPRQKTPTNVAHGPRTAPPTISVNSTTSPARRPSRAVAFLIQTSSGPIQQVEGTRLNLDNPASSSPPAAQPNQEIPVESQATHVPDVGVAPTGGRPKPKRTLSKREMEALALASGAGAGLPPTQEEVLPQRRSVRNTGSSSSTATPPEEPAAKPSGAGKATRKSKRGKS